jgi:hypothetical protein
MNPAIQYDEIQCGPNAEEKKNQKNEGFRDLSTKLKGLSRKRQAPVHHRGRIRGVLLISFLALEFEF